MATKRSTIKSAAGVRLELLEQISAHGVVLRQDWRLRTLRPAQPRVFADQAGAEDAFDMEVMACLSDPIVQSMIQRGASEFD